MKNTREKPVRNADLRLTTRCGQSIVIFGAVLRTRENIDDFAPRDDLFAQMLQDWNIKQFREDAS